MVCEFLALISIPRFLCGMPITESDGLADTLGHYILEKDT